MYSLLISLNHDHNLALNVISTLAMGAIIGAGVLIKRSDTQWGALAGMKGATPSYYRF